MTNEIDQIIKITDTLHWGRYETSQDTRHKNIPKKLKIKKEPNLIHKVQVFFYHW